MQLCVPLVLPSLINSMMMVIWWIGLSFRLRSKCSLIPMLQKSCAAEWLQHHIHSFHWYSLLVVCWDITNLSWVSRVFFRVVSEGWTSEKKLAGAIQQQVQGALALSMSCLAISKPKGAFLNADLQDSQWHPLMLACVQTSSPPENREGTSVECHY